MLPPTAFIQYRFLPANAMFRPYVGLGITYAHFQKERGSGQLTAILNTGGPGATFKVDDKWAASYQIGGTVRARDWSAWHIEVSEPKQTYWLNHYPKVGHTIYLQDFEATIPIAGGASVVVRVVDGNDRQIDNAEEGRPDRLRIIKGVVDKPLPGQMLRLDVLGVTAKM